MGQRWISDPEPTLGLGIVLEADGRFVEISFPAAETSRQYATQNAPLTRVIFKPEETIRTMDDETLTVKQVEENDGIISYLALTKSGEEKTVSELELDFAVVFSKPQDRLFAGQIDKNSAFKLRVATLRHFGKHQQSEALGLLGGRVSLLPHQIYIGSEVASRHAPRVLLADEVGLGKTIEAGLIIHQQIITGAAGRVLIIVPDSLVHQWLVEMLRRFNLSFSIFDHERFQAHGDDEGNAFDNEQLILCSLQELSNHPDMQEAMLDAKWDLTVIDEAHHLGWNIDEETEEAIESDEYKLAKQLTAISKGLLLLTATPEQLGIDSHFARLHLLDPARFHSLSEFKAEEAKYGELNQVVTILLDAAENEATPNKADLALLEQWLDEEKWNKLNTICEENDGEELFWFVDDVVDELLDQHGTGRVLFRNTRQAISGFPERKLLPAELTVPGHYNLIFKENPFITAPDMEVEYDLRDDWPEFDPRVDWLIAKLKELSPNKVLVICADDDSAKALELHVRLSSGIRTAVFHSGMSLVNRDRAAAYFADQDEGAQVLICSEIGSEGRNFQFAHHMVLFDLPTNPDLLEQRIGRLDRIGQSETVNIHVPYFKKTTQEIYLNWYHLGLNAFEQTCAIGNSVKTEVEGLLDAAILSGVESDDYQNLIDTTQSHATKLREQLESGRNRLLELNSHRPQKAHDAIEAIETAENPGDVRHYMKKIFDFFGVDHESGGDNLTVLHKSDHMLTDHFPMLGDDGATVTFQRETALSRDDVMLLSWEHPMVSGAMELVMTHEYGNTAICTMKHPKLKAGTWFLETIFTTQVTAPQSEQVYRFMPLQTIRLLLDDQGRNLGAKLTHQSINEIARRIDPRVASDLVKQLREPLQKVITQSQQMAEGFLPTLKQRANDKLNEFMTSEIDRLTSLQAKNPGIRDEEITHLTDSHERVAARLDQAQIKFDGMRIVICT